jgi:signal transduction histidine kinase
VLRRLLPQDPHLVRRLTYGLAAVLAVVGMVGSSYEARQEWPYVVVVMAIPVSALLSLPWRERRSAVLAVGAAIVASAASDIPELWPTVASLVFVSISEDQRASPWLGWTGGVVGSTASLVLSYFHGTDTANVAPFLATGVGGAAGLLLRSWVRGRELVGEAEELRGQAAWLEQRTSVARELHDVVGHHVTAMVVQAEAGQLGDPRDALKAIGELGRTALSELDSLVVHLRDPGAPLTVSAPPRLLDIDELLAEPLRRTGMAVDVRLGDGLALAGADVLTVYRITQEALTNVVRHAGASHAWVEVSRDGAAVRLRVSDDGAGPPAERTRGSGLLGIEERVAARGGRMELIGRPGGGTMLDVTFPLGEP